MNVGNSILELPIEDLILNSFRQRLVVDNESLADLAESIKAHGIIQPIVVRKVDLKYEIIAGERRYRAAKIAGLLKVPAILTNLNEKQIAELSIVENVQRKSLNAIEEAKSYKTLLDKDLMTINELANKMGVSEIVVDNKLKLLTLDAEVQDALLNEKISERHARSLLKINDAETQKKYLNQIIDERLTVKQVEDMIKQNIVETDSSNTENNSFNNVNTSKPTSFFNDLENEAADIQFAPPRPVTPVTIVPEPVILKNPAVEEEIEML